MLLRKHRRFPGRANATQRNMLLFVCSESHIHTNSCYSCVRKNLATGHEHWTGMAKKLAPSCVRGNGEGRGKRTESKPRNGPIRNKKKGMGKRKRGKREKSEAAMEGREVRDASLGEGNDSASWQLACVLSS